MITPSLRTIHTKLTASYISAWHCASDALYYGPQPAQRGLNNMDANQQIKRLYTRLYTGEQNLSINAVSSQKVQLDHVQRSQILQQAFEIYDSIDEKKNALTINTMLTLFSHLKQPQHVRRIWDDIQLCKPQPSDIDDNAAEHAVNRHLLFELLMIVCIKAKNTDIHKCADILQWMHASQVALDLHHSSISQLISKCTSKHHLKGLQLVHTLLEHDVIKHQQNGDKFIKTALIAAYGRCHDLPRACAVFESVSADTRCTVCINAMLKALVHNRCEEGALTLYDRHCALHDNISHFLAIKACKNLKQFERGHQIISHVNVMHSSVEFKIGLLTFYGESGDIERALTIFAHTQKNLHCLSVMMQALLRHRDYQAVLHLYATHVHYIDENVNECHIYAIKACAHLSDVERGKQIHKRIEPQLKGNNAINDCKVWLAVQNVLLYFYGKCQCIQDALDVFDAIDGKYKDAVTFNTMMQAYIMCQHYTPALDLYDSIPESLKDNKTHSLAIKACMNSNNVQRGVEIHEHLQTLIKGK